MNETLNRRNCNSHLKQHDFKMAYFEMGPTFIYGILYFMNLNTIIKFMEMKLNFTKNLISKWGLLLLWGLWDLWWDLWGLWGLWDLWD